MPKLCLAIALPILAFIVVGSPLASAADEISGAPSTIVARQGEAVVTLEDVDAFAAGIPEAQRGGFFNSPTRIENAILGMLMQKQLAAEARKLGLDKDPVVQTQVRRAEDEALSKARMQRFREDLKLPDFNGLAQEEYIAHKRDYVARGKLVVKHVLIGTKDRSEAEAMKIAETVEKEARSRPDQFEALVEKYSDDPSKSANHGEMEDAGDASKYVPEFAAASAKLSKPGEISPIVKTEYGFHVIKLVERTPDKPRTFAEVKPEIVARLRNEYIEKQARTHTDTLRNLPLDANADLVASLRTRYDNAAASANTKPAQQKP
ncbi:MAG: hypothetical protein GXC76_03905 [Rhodanobacteraceae bacterium]|jgi:peptidyl-prolyl cis-trans isomerase C|nr:hypothetical protein [Rhodanobacteraceae bacterium]